MPQVSPVFSVEPAARRVYHDNSLCAERYHIEPQEKRSGTGDRPLCEQCAELDRQGK